MDKDYYKILGVAQTADGQEIKKAYRQLAMKYHPDRNQEDPSAEAQFKDVQQAYEVLSHPASRSAYNQHRWYRRGSNDKMKHQRITPYEIFKKGRELNLYLSTLHRDHINVRALNNYIKQIFSASTIHDLLEDNDSATNELIVLEFLKSMTALPLESTVAICTSLKKVGNNNAKTIAAIETYIRNKKRSAFYSRYTPLLMLVISILICVLIYYVSSNNR